MQELEMTWGRTARVRWFIVWQIVVAVGWFILFTSVAAALANRMLGWSLAPPNSPGNIGGYAFMSLLFSNLVVQRALRKKYRDFRIVLVPNPSS